MSSIKHFPGHGDCEVDSHLGLPTINYDLADQRATELAQQLCKAHESLGLTYELINLKEYQNPEGNIFYMVYAMAFEYEYEGTTIEGTTKIIIPL